MQTGITPGKVRCKDRVNISAHLPSKKFRRGSDVKFLYNTASGLFAGCKFKLQIKERLSLHEFF